MPVCANKCANVTPHLCISIAVDPKGWSGSSPGEWWNVVNVQHLGHQLRPRYHSFITRFSHLSLSALTSLTSLTPAVAAVAVAKVRHHQFQGVPDLGKAHTRGGISNERLNVHQFSPGNCGESLEFDLTIRTAESIGVWPNSSIWSMDHGKFSNEICILVNKNRTNLGSQMDRRKKAICWLIRLVVSNNQGHEQPWTSMTAWSSDTGKFCLDMFGCNMTSPALEVYRQWTGHL